MLKKSIAEGTVDFKLFADASENKLDIIVLFTALFTLILTYVYGIARKMNYDRCLAYIFAGIYFVFVIVATIVAC